MRRFAIVRLYCGDSGKKGFYNSQEVGLAKAMLKFDYECYIFYPSKEKNIVEEKVEEGIVIINVPSKCYGNHSRYDWKILKKYKIDVVEIESDNQLFAPSIIGFCDRNRIPVFSYIGTTGSDTNNKLKKYLLDILFERNVKSYRKHKNFVKTQAVNSELKKYGIHNIAVCPVGLDATIIPKVLQSDRYIKNKYRLPQDKKLLLFVGRLESYKKPLSMIELLLSLSDEYYGIIVGDGSLNNQVDACISDYGVSERMIWIKRLPNIEIHELYKISDYYINLNDKEIFGMSILEAMYQGCNVIAFHAPGPDQIIEHGKNGFLVNSLDEIRTIINSGYHLSSECIKQRITNHFTWDITANVFHKWINDNVSDHPIHI